MTRTEDLAGVATVANWQRFFWLGIMNLQERKMSRFTFLGISSKYENVEIHVFGNFIEI